MPCGNETAVCGWDELFNADLLGAAYTMYDFAFNGWTVFILFLTFQFMLYMKTQNVNLMWVTGLLFTAMFAISTVPFVKPIAIQFMFIIVVLELAGILYFLIFK